MPEPLPVPVYAPLIVELDGEPPELEVPVDELPLEPELNVPPEPEPEPPLEAPEPAEPDPPPPLAAPLAEDKVGVNTVVASIAVTKAARAIVVTVFIVSLLMCRMRLSAARAG